MIKRKTWEEFRTCGMLWWINMILHTFGWAIAVNVKEDGSISDVFPARVKFRGFQEEYNTEGYIKVSEYLKNNSDQLLVEAQD